MFSTNVNDTDYETLEPKKETRIQHTEAFLRQLDRHSQSTHSTAILLRPRAQSGNPAFILKVRMSRAGTFMSNKVRDERARLVFPVRCLVGYREGDFGTVDVHDSLRTDDRL